MSTINTLDFESKLTNELDKAIVQKSVTSFMADNSFRQKFVGARTVLVPDVDFSGLGDYDRDGGFTTGAVNVNQESYQLTQDRARSFSIDREDMDETGIAGLAGQIMGEFVRTKVAPEIDAYTLSKLANLAATKEHTVSLESGETVTENCLKLINSAIEKVSEEVGYDEEIVVFVNPTVYSALSNTSELTRSLEVGDFTRGELTTKVQKINNAYIIPVSGARMKTAYTFKDGKTDGETDGGFVPASDAEDIGILAMPKKAGMLIKKTDKVRIFTPDRNQQMDAYKFDYRLYYDLLVKKSKENSIYAYIY